MNFASVYVLLIYFIFPWLKHNYSKNIQSFYVFHMMPSLFFLNDIISPLIREGVYMCGGFLTCPRPLWLQEMVHCFRGEVGLTGVQEMDWIGGKGPGTKTKPRERQRHSDLCVFSQPLLTRTYERVCKHFALCSQRWPWRSIWATPALTSRWAESQCSSSPTTLL